MDKIGNYRKVGILNVSIPREPAEILTNFKLKKSSVKHVPSVIYHNARYFVNYRGRTVSHKSRLGKTAFCFEPLFQENGA